MKKRALSILLVLCMVMTLLPTMAWAAGSDFTIDDNGVLTQYNGSGGDVTIPSDVTSIGDHAFSGCTSLINVTIPDSVTSIEAFAFNGCSNLTSITIPNSVTSIAHNVFYNCSGLTSIILPPEITYIGQNTFRECSNLKNISIPHGVTSIGMGAFQDCSSLANITIPDGVTSIGSSAFKGCSSLTSVTIPNGVSLIEYGAFWGCNSLTNITIPDRVISIGDYAFYDCSKLTSISIPNSVTAIGHSAFCSCSSLKSITIPDGVTSIENWTFWHCNDLTSIIMPESVTSIGNGAFQDCNSLTSIAIPDGVTSIETDAFKDCSSLTSITIPDGVTSIESSTFGGCSSLTSITIPDGVTSIGYGAFWDCSSLTSVTIPNRVTSIESNAFRGCSSLTSITIPNEVTSIGYGAFKDCSGLTSITIPDGVTSLEDEIFQGCTSLSSVTIPDSVTSIGNSAFSGCSNLTNVTIPNGVTSIGNGTFSGCSNLTSITITNSVISIGNSAFSSCSSLTSITIPNSVTSIGNSAFSSCSSLTSITIPNGVTSIENSTFSSCSNLSSITIPNSVTSIGEWTFAGCSNLISITVPNSVTSIGRWAFCECTSLTSITIPNSVTSIADRTFSSCSSLTSVIIPPNIISIGNETFIYCYGLSSVTIPSGVTDIGNEAFGSCRNLTNVTIPSSVTSIGDSTFSGCGGLTDIYYAGTEAQWKSIALGTGNGPLTSATIHYNSTGPDDVGSDNMNPVYFLSGWNAATRTVQFGDNTLSTPITYTVADAVDVSSIDSLLNKYVLVAMEQGNSSLEYTITNIQPVESKIGTVSATGEHSLTIDGTTYPVREDYKLASHDGKEILYHISNGTIMGFDLLEEKTGTLEAWDSTTGRVTIDGQVYPTNYISNIESIDELLGTQVYFSLSVTSGYTPLIKVSAYSVSDTLTISKITPNSGAIYPQAITIYFGSAVQLGTGNILVKDIQTDKVLGNFSIQGQDMPINDLMILNFFNGGGPRNTEFYLEFEDGTLLNPQTKESYGIISTKNTWHMCTLATQSWSMKNPVGREIADKLYMKVYPVAIAHAVKSNSDGTKGLCFGMSATAGSITKGNPTFLSFSQNSIDSLSEVSWEDISPQLSGMTAEEFIGLAHVMKFYPSILTQKILHINDLEGLCDAVRSFQTGIGEAVVIDVGGKGSHSILAASITEIAKGFKIIAYDSNAPDAWDEITVNVENGKYASWTISCPMDSSYDTHVKENFSNQITWSMPCKTVYQMAISDSQIFSGALDLLEVSGFDSFKLENQSGKIVNVANNIINDASQNLVIPVDFDSDNAVFRNYETYKNFVCWVENDTPITIQGTNTSTSNIVLTGNSSVSASDKM